jgi:ferredoxin
MVSIDKNTCIGCCACVAACPEGFEMSDDGKAKVKDANAKCMKEAAESCPVDAIKL